LQETFTDGKGTSMRAVWVEKCRKNVTPCDAVRVVLGAILLLVAGLKGHQPATESAPETGILDSRWLLIAVVEVELFLGLLLLSGKYAEISLQTTLGCVALSACFSLHKALSDAARCGCSCRNRQAKVVQNEDSGWPSSHVAGGCFGLEHVDR